MFSRQSGGDYDIYTVKPDGSGVTRLTRARGNDAHQGWSPDGEDIVFATSRMGFKDEAIYTDAPQPYGELFVMRADGTGLRQLTDNQWEDGTPAWQPNGRLIDEAVVSRCSVSRAARSSVSARPSSIRFAVCRACPCARVSTTGGGSAFAALPARFTGPLRLRRPSARSSQLLVRCFR